MERQPVISSSISSVGYDPDAQVLEIEFTSGDVYQFYDVPEQVHVELLASGSLGSYFNHYVRNNYVYARL